MADQIAEQLGAELELARRRAGKSREATAEALDVSQNTVGRWERGETTPNVLQTWQLADFYGADFTQMVGRIFGTGFDHDGWPEKSVRREDPEPWASLVKDVVKMSSGHEREERFILFAAGVAHRCDESQGPAAHGLAELALQTIKILVQLSTEEVDVLWAKHILITAHSYNGEYPNHQFIRGLTALAEDAHRAWLSSVAGLDEIARLEERADRKRPNPTQGPPRKQVEPASRPDDGFPRPFFKLAPEPTAKRADD